MFVRVSSWQKQSNRSMQHYPHHHYIWVSNVIGTWRLDTKRESFRAYFDMPEALS